MPRLEYICCVTPDDLACFVHTLPTQIHPDCVLLQWRWNGDNVADKPLACGGVSD